MGDGRDVLFSHPLALGLQGFKCTGWPPRNSVGKWGISRAQAADCHRYHELLPDDPQMCTTSPYFSPHQGEARPSPQTRVVLVGGREAHENL